MTNSDQPAFPWHASPGNQDNLGLTKREWFAGIAMQGLLAHEAMVAAPNVQAMRRGFSLAAVEYADALLSELEKKQA